jgi:hypothetical protein
MSRVTVLSFIPNAAEFNLSVMMPVCTRVHDVTLCFVFFSFIPAWLTITSTMTTVPAMTAMTKQVHRDKEY